MIRGHCRTNLDDWKRENWPKEFVAVPRVGEWVQAESGHNLKVCQVTYCITEGYSGNDRTKYPAIIVELNK